MADPGNSGSSRQGVEVKRAEFNELNEGELGPGGSLGHLLNVRFDVEAVLGRTVLPIEQILELGSGSVVELDRLISESVELVVQGVKVARGEVVVVDDRFAIRIQEIMKPSR
ncbi:MAG: flagellar motor switch protein FliN [Planctomycetes bacterium]|nr:flagellar motor switch protein FliN [Planctomycetota bacterium]